MSKKSSAVELELLSGQRQSSESDNAVVACNDWLRIGIGRSLPKLAVKYNDIQPKSAPTQSLTTLQQWSAKFNWQARATEFDAGWEARKNAERQAVMDYGLSLDYERVTELIRLAEFLKAQLYERGVTFDESGNPTDKPGPYHNVWVPDVKSIGGGEFAERVDIERFNSAIFEQYRAVLDDIAKETGGRIKKQQIDLDVDVSKLSDEELERLIKTKG